MSTLVVVGAQWGDEGKGKVVDALAAEAHVVARYAGGNNAGHTLVVEGRQLITHLVPSGCLYPGTPCVLGSGMVIDPDVFRQEVEAIQALGLLRGGELRVSLDAHLILPYHRAIDGLREDRAHGTAQKIGTTRRGVGPAYESKAGRRGVRVRDLFDAVALRQRLELNAGLLDPEFERGGVDVRVDVEGTIARAAAWAEWLRPMVCDASEFVHDAIVAGRRVLFEGAQGALLDLDHGTYPYVTSSSTIAGGVCTGLGVGPTRIDQVWGITKAYATRVGSGPFPSRLDGPEGEQLRTLGGEYGATTGRPRDTGWLDLPALRYAARINGMTGLCVTKLDVLAAMPRVQVCVAYRDGRRPGTDDLTGVEPVLEAVPGFGEPGLADAVMRARTLAELPPAVRAYLDQIAQAVDVPIALASVGPDRVQTIRLLEPFGGP
jgi:adenylosuccinate synthase